MIRGFTSESELMSVKPSVKFWPTKRGSHSWPLDCMSQQHQSGSNHIKDQNEADEDDAHFWRKYEIKWAQCLLLTKVEPNSWLTGLCSHCVVFASHPVQIKSPARERILQSSFCRQALHQNMLSWTRGRNTELTTWTLVACFANSSLVFISWRDEMMIYKNKLEQTIPRW